VEKTVIWSNIRKIGRIGQCLLANPTVGGLQSQHAIFPTGKQTTSGVFESGRRLDQFASQSQLPLPQQTATITRAGAGAGITGMSEQRLRGIFGATVAINGRNGSSEFFC